MTDPGTKDETRDTKHGMVEEEEQAELEAGDEAFTAEYRVRLAQPGIRNPKPETRDLEQETRNTKLRAQKRRMQSSRLSLRSTWCASP